MYIKTSAVVFDVMSSRIIEWTAEPNRIVWVIVVDQVLQVFHHYIRVVIGFEEPVVLSVKLFVCLHNAIPILAPQVVVVFLLTLGHNDRQTRLRPGADEHKFVTPLTPRLLHGQCLLL